MLQRREFTQLIGGMGLSFLLPGLSFAAARKRGKERKKSLITLWMAGGPSQLETWDPHPGTGIGGETKSIRTKVEGLEIADLFPRVAEQIHHLSVIRSLTSKEGDHERGTYFLKTGYRPDPTLKHPSMGAIAVHELPEPGIEIPQHISLLKSQWPSRGGFLGPDLDAFKILNPGLTLHNMKAPVESERQAKRLKDLEKFSNAFSKGRFSKPKRTMHQQAIERALTMMRSEQLNAFLVKDEPDEIKDAYGDSQFGRGCLVARRLVEEGVRAVEVTLNGFDTHANNHEGHITQAKILDPAFAALINDLKRRDLLDSTIVLCLGEFGRTPKINGLGGRDHWPHGFSCVVGGGGLRSGIVIGETSIAAEAKAPAEPIQIPDLFATIFKKLGVDFDTEYDTPIGRPMRAIDKDAKLIEKLLG